MKPFVLPMRFLFPLLMIFLSACSRPAFEFRGITDLSSCVSAVAAEEEQGGELLEQRATQDPSSRDVSEYEIAGELFDQDVRVSIVCGEDGLLFVNYLTEVESEADAEYLHQYFESRLSETFGEPAHLQAPDNRLYGAAARLSGALPGRYASYWCRGGNVSVKVLSDLKYRDISEYSVAVVLDFKSGIACPADETTLGG